MKKDKKIDNRDVNKKIYKKPTIAKHGDLSFIKIGLS
jgi:hypothetical protein